MNDIIHQLQRAVTEKTGEEWIVRCIGDGKTFNFRFHSRSLIRDFPGHSISERVIKHIYGTWHDFISVASGKIAEYRNANLRWRLEHPGEFDDCAARYTRIFESVAIDG